MTDDELIERYRRIPDCGPCEDDNHAECLRPRGIQCCCADHPLITAIEALIAERDAALFHCDVKEHHRNSALAALKASNDERDALRHALDAMLRTHTAEWQNTPGLAARQVAVDLLGGYEAWAGDGDRD